MDIKVDAEFQALIPPISDEEYRQLEANIVQDGCREPLSVWYVACELTSCKYCYQDVSPDEWVSDIDIWTCPSCTHGVAPTETILLDGHNRHKICTEHKMAFDTVYIDLPNRDAAADWIDANQLGRRNLSPDQMTVMRGRRFNRMKKKPHDGGKGKKRSDHHGDGHLPTAERLAEEHGVSKATIERDGKIAAFLESQPERAADVIAGRATLAEVRQDMKRETVVADLEDAAKLEAKAIKGVYDVIVIDPPWQMKKIERDCRPNQVAFEYPTMTRDELEDLEIPCADDCHVWLWTTHKHLPLAIDLLFTWELKYVCTFVWHKPGGYQPVGLPQYNCEFIIYARRGSPKFIDTKAFPVCFDAPRGAHSEKPEEFYEVVRRVTAGRRLDMFSRRSIEGFDGWGKEAE